MNELDQLNFNLNEIKMSIMLNRLWLIEHDCNYIHIYAFSSTTNNWQRKKSFQRHVDVHIHIYIHFTYKKLLQFVNE